MASNHTGERENEKAGTRRSFLRNTSVIATSSVGFIQAAAATPSTVQPEAHQTELTLTETEGDTVHYIVDVTGNTLEAVDSKKEDNDKVTYSSNYATCDGYLNNGTDKYTFSADDEISRIVIEDGGNLEASLSGAIDGPNGKETKVEVRGEQWGTESDDPAIEYSFTVEGYIYKRDKSTIEDNDETTTGSNPDTETASGYIDPGHKDVWSKDGQFTSFHCKPWGHELNIEMGTLPRGTSD